MQERITLQFDGGSRGNPGPSGVGVVLSAEDGTPLVTLGRFIGQATNNVAEYRGLIIAMQEARKLGARRVVIRGDSELIIKQMRGEYKVKNAALLKLHGEARELLKTFEEARIEHNLRHHNELADKLANLAMDRRADVTDVDSTGGIRLGKAPASEARPVASATPHAPAGGSRFVCVRCACAVTLERPSTFPARELKPFGCQCGRPCTKPPPESQAAAPALLVSRILIE